MKILAIDPGTIQSAWCLYDGTRVVQCDIQENKVVLAKLRDGLPNCPVFIEMIASYGMPVGREVFETVVWIGRFFEALESQCNTPKLTYRMEVKMHLCNSARAKDANIRQSIIDRFPATGGGKTPQIGTTKQPGPLFGVRGDIWAALAVAIYNHDKILVGV